MARLRPVLIVIGVLASMLIWRRLTDEELNLYMERAYVLEQQVQTGERRERAWADTWHTLTTSLDNLFDGASEGWLLVNKEGRIRHSNTAFVEIVRHWQPKAENLEGMPLAEIIPNFNNTVLYKAQHDLATGNKPWYGEVQLVPDVWVLLWIWPLGDDMAMVMRDVSHRHRSEAFLQTAEMVQWRRQEMRVAHHREHLGAVLVSHASLAVEIEEIPARWLVGGKPHMQRLELTGGHVHRAVKTLAEPGGHPGMVGVKVGADHCQHR